MSDKLTDAQLDNLERLIDRIERANEKPIGIALSAVPHLRELLAYHRAEGLSQRAPDNSIGNIEHAEYDRAPHPEWEPDR